MATLTSIRVCFARSFNVMRCTVFGINKVRSCHNGSKDTEQDPTKKDSSTDESTSDHTSDSYEDTEGIDDESISERILNASLQFVPEYGWTSQAIAEGARIEGFSGMAEGMFLREGGDLVLHFINQCNYDLGDYLADNSRTIEENRKKIGQTDFIKDAVKFRLEMIIPYIDSWPQAMGLMVYPSCATEALQSVADMTDDIWYHSNDSSTDMNWYLKRGSLATIYGLTELYMVRDGSEDFQNTWHFLDRRFQEIRMTGNIKQSCSKLGEDVTNLACSSLTLLRNIVGFNKWNR